MYCADISWHNTSCTHYADISWHHRQAIFTMPITADITHRRYVLFWHYLTSETSSMCCADISTVSAAAPHNRTASAMADELKVMHTLNTTLCCLKYTFTAHYTLYNVQCFKVYNVEYFLGYLMPPVLYKQWSLPGSYLMLEDRGQTLYSEHSIVNSEQWTEYSEQWTVNRVQWTVNSEQSTVNSEQWTVNRKQWNLYSGVCTV